MAALWSPYILGLLVSIGVLAAVASLVWRHRHRPGGTELVAFLVVILAWAAIYCVALLTHDPPLRRWLEGVMYLAITTVPVAWLVFVLVYSGHHSRIDPRLLGALLLGAVGLGSLAVTNAAHHWFWASTEVVIVDGIALLDVSSAWGHRVTQAFIYLIVLVGAVVIIRESIGTNGLYHDQTAVLLIGSGGPIVASLLPYAGVELIEGLSLTPYAFTISGIAFGYAVLRIDLLEVLPATRTVGRDLAVDQLAEGVLIVDAGGRIVDANRVGAELFDQTPVGLVGSDARSLFAVEADTPLEALPREVHLDGRILGVTVSPVRTGTEVPIGHTVVLRDISDRRLRKTQLEVLNRVLRHNLRNKLAVVQGHLRLLDEHHGLEDDPSFRTVTDAVEELIELSDRSREFERLKALEGLETEAIDVVELIEACLDDVAPTKPDVRFEVDIPDDLVVETHHEVLAIAVENLLSNAVVHNDQAVPHVEVSAEETDGGIRIAVADDGPGIPPEELTVLSAGRETAIQHGSGLGLWVTKWAVQYLRGEVRFEHRSPRGTRALVDVPELSGTDATMDADVASRSDPVSADSTEAARGP